MDELNENPINQSDQINQSNQSNQSGQINQSGQSDQINQSAPINPINQINQRAGLPLSAQTLFWGFSLTAVFLIVAGFLVPPLGVIDPSVLTAVGELFAFAALAQIPEAIRSGRGFRYQRGETEIHISGDDRERL